MKTNFFIAGLLIFILGSCSVPKYVPPAEYLDVADYGSYIQVITEQRQKIHGELIAVDGDEMIVLEEGKNICQSIPMKDVNKFTIYFAQPKNYGWTIPTYGLASMSHGYAAMFSLPVNLLVTSIVSYNGAKEFRYNNKQLVNITDMSMFARFPGGLPEGITLKDLE